MAKVVLHSVPDLCATGFPINWTSDAGDLSFTGRYNACTSDGWVLSDMDEERSVVMMDSYDRCDDPDFDEAYEYWSRAVAASCAGRALAQRIRTALLEQDSVTVRTTARAPRRLASTVECDSDAHHLLVAVYGHFDP